MKCELLKRTAIALFVGSVISTYAMAEDDTLVDATNNLKNAIKQEVKIQTEASKAEQDKNIQGVKTAVSELAKGIDDALLPAIATNRTDIDKNTSNIKNLATGIRDGLVPAIEANRTDIDANKAALDTKADKSEFKKFADQTNANAALLITMAGKVDQNKQDVEALQSDMEKAATAVSTLSDNVKELNSAQNDINENFNNQLLAANQTLDEHQAEIEKIKNLQGYDSLTKVENIVSNKADQDYVEGLEQDVKINTSDIKELSVGIRDNILPAIEANRTDIDKNASRITDTRNKQVLQNARLDNHGERIEANKAAIGELAKATDEAVTNLGNAVSGLDEDLAGTQDAVAENRKDIDKNASRIADTRNKQVLQNARLDNHNSRIDANKADVDTLKNRADGAAAAVNLLAQNIALNKTNIESKADQDYVEGLEQDVKINTSDIKELSVGIRDNILPALEANRTDIDKNASRITDTRNKQVLQNARLDNHSSRIDANKAALESKADKTALAAKADKTALEAKADKTALEAKADKTALEAKADKVYVGSLEQNIRDNSNRIETNKVNVSALRNDINSHAKRLDHLDNRVNKLDKDLKRGLATQAALTGLFQPYTVGKANFTAAVGGYKSQTAVAIGTGYRYNKHVATKAGVAFTQGGAAYNVGVNFEW